MTSMQTCGEKGRKKLLTWLRQAFAKRHLTILPLAHRDFDLICFWRNLQKSEPVQKPSILEDGKGFLYEFNKSI